jgi:formyltetrahydrofolate hydrolase
MDRDEMSNLYIGSSIDASYQVSVHLAKRFQISFRSINTHGRHKQFLFLIGRFLKIFSSETAWPKDQKLSRKHLWKVLTTHRCFLPSFRGEEFLKSANQKQESPVVAMFVNGLERNEQSL